MLAVVCRLNIDSPAPSCAPDVASFRAVRPLVPLLPDAVHWAGEVLVARSQLFGFSSAHAPGVLAFPYLLTAPKTGAASARLGALRKGRPRVPEAIYGACEVAARDLHDVQAIADLAAEGRGSVYVTPSHAVAALASLCTRAPHLPRTPLAIDRAGVDIARGLLFIRTHALLSSVARLLLHTSESNSASNAASP